jgi:hypothetical protein
MTEMHAAADASAQAVTTAELNRDAGTMISDMITHVESIQEPVKGIDGKHAERIRRETGRLLATLEATRPGTVDMSCFLRRQPRAEDFAFPGRTEALVPEARRRLEKSKYMFPEPRAAIDAAAMLWGATEGAEELRVRIAYFLARMNIVQDGVAASAACRRLLQAATCQAADACGKSLTAEQTDLLAAAKAALQSFMYEARKHGRR